MENLIKYNQHFSVNSQNYRYGFGGHEKNNEILGEANQYDFGNYGLDVRIGRRWNIDPMIAGMPSNSSYSVFNNNPLFFVDPTGLSPDDIVFNGVDEDGEKVELARIKTDVVDVEFDTNLKVGTNYETKSMELTKEQEAKIDGVDAVGVNLAASVALEAGFQADISLIGVVNGQDKGAVGVSIGTNFLVGVEGGIDLFNVSFYFANDINNFRLTDLEGFEQGIQGSASGLGGSFFEGVEYTTQSMFYRNSEGSLSVRSPIYEQQVYTGFSFGATVGVLPADGSVYWGASSFIFKDYSKKPKLRGASGSW